MLKTVLIENFLAKAQFEEYVFLENETEISRVYVQLNNVSIHNKNTWQETMVFLNKNMIQFEAFFRDFEDVFKD